MVKHILSEKENVLLIDTLGYALTKIEDEIDAYEQELRPHECAEVMLLDILRKDITLLIKRIKDPIDLIPEPVVIKPIELVKEIDPDSLEIL